MARSIDVSCPPVFNTHREPAGLGIRWQKWKKGFLNLPDCAPGITNINGQKRALLLHCAGDKVQEIFETLEVDGPDGDIGTYQAAGAALSAYFCPKTNKHFERHIFRSCTQDSGETIHKYVTRLRTLVETCQFHDTSEEIVDQIIEKCASNKL